jgi:hypothetical protein
VWYISNICRFNLKLKFKNLQPTQALAEIMNLTKRTLSMEVYLVLVKITKDKAVPVQAMKAYRGSEGILPLTNSALDGRQCLALLPS